MSVRSSFSTEKLGTPSLPVLLLVGEREIMYSTQAAQKRARQIIPGIQAEIDPKAGHMLNGDQPEIVPRRILEFL
jgi:pimeloyl-ACP methyl ester carboxylesterase